MKKLTMYEDNRPVWEVVDEYPKEPTVLYCESTDDDEFIQSVDYMHGLLRRAEGVSVDEV